MEYPQHFFTWFAIKSILSHSLIELWHRVGGLEDNSATTAASNGPIFGKNTKHSPRGVSVPRNEEDACCHRLMTGDKNYLKKSLLLSGSTTLFLYPLKMFLEAETNIS